MNSSPTMFSKKKKPVPVTVLDYKIESLFRNQTWAYWRIFTDRQSPITVRTSNIYLTEEDMTRGFHYLSVEFTMSLMEPPYVVTSLDWNNIGTFKHENSKESLYMAAFESLMKLLIVDSKITHYNWTNKREMDHLP